MPPEPARSNFQVELGGIITLLSQHLYSGPQVFIRELLQNAVDAIHARRLHDEDLVGEIRLEVIGDSQSRPTLVLSDNGIGLTEEEVHSFLSTIGQSSKRGYFDERPDGFLGQFGIGLLSGFVVCDEIVLVTKSARDSHPAVQWSGNSDGTYSTKILTEEIATGTKVFLRSKAGMENYFEQDEIIRLAKHYGEFLPESIEFVENSSSHSLNSAPPWSNGHQQTVDNAELLNYGREIFGQEFMDAIPLSAEESGLTGTAFVLARPGSLAHRPTHRIYLKGMLLSEKADNILPDWAFFVQCAANANSLRPTASRESFYEDQTLEETRNSLGKCLRSYLVNLSRTDPKRLSQLIDLHHVAIKTLSLEDDECLRLFCDWLPFETSLGAMPLGEYRRENPILRVASTVDEFRQVSQLSAAQSFAVINGGYAFDTEILNRVGELIPDVQVEPLDIEDLSEMFGEPTLDEREAMADFLDLADEALEPFECRVDIAEYRPAEVPALYMTNRDADFLRSIGQSQDVSDELWSSVLDGVAKEASTTAYSKLFLNTQNPLITQVSTLTDRDIQKQCVEMIYVQALLSGHFPLRAKERKILNEGLLNLIQWATEGKG